MTTINNQVKRICGLLDTKDLNDFEQNFVQSIADKTNEGEKTTMLTEKQIAVIERIFNKHFAA